MGEIREPQYKPDSESTHLLYICNTRVLPRILPAPRSFTWRAMIVGLLVGILINLYNAYVFIPRSLTGTYPHATLRASIVDLGFDRQVWALQASCEWRRSHSSFSQSPGQALPRGDRLSIAWWERVPRNCFRGL
jgi:hypothetical protein